MRTKAPSAVFATMAFLVALGVFSHVTAIAKSTGSGHVDPASVCLDRQQRMGWSQAEYRVCTDQQNRQISRNVLGLACLGKTCQLRLMRTDAGLYEAGGFMLHLVFDAGESVIRGSLAGMGGRHASLEQFCGAGGCPGKPEWVSGDYPGVSYTPIGDPTAPDAIILRLPRTTVH